MEVCYFHRYLLVATLQLELLSKSVFSLTVFSNGQVFSLPVVTF